VHHDQGGGHGLGQIQRRLDGPSPPAGVEPEVITPVQLDDPSSALVDYTDHGYIHVS
jgi:hypothetical protein